MSHKLKHTLITNRELQQILKTKGFVGNLLSRFTMKILGVDKMNEIYDKTYDTNVDDFIDNAAKLQNNTFVIPEKDIASIPENGPVIFLCNHPLGGWDGLGIIKTLLKVRPDTKFLVNFILSRIEPLSPYLIKINPFENNKGAYSNIAGIKNMYNHILEGKSLCILPAGEVSTKYGKSKFVEDRDWQDNVIKLVKKANVPVISCYIEGQNSRKFHVLGKIHPMLRTIRLPKEFIRKKNSEIFIRFSRPMHPKTIKSIEDIKTLGKVLKAKTYCLGNNIYSINKMINDHDVYKDIITPTSNDALINEIEKIKANDLLFKTENYLCLFSKKQDVPNIFREITRLREITFREIGEGTGKDMDADKYDEYYHHLFLWDENASKIVGAYRIGLGNSILKTTGIDGFYVNSLFELKKDFYPYMEKSMEMGRSFIVSEYQRRTLPLFLLWKGIYNVTLRYPEYQYLIGPASISNFYSKHAKILIIEYLKRCHTWTNSSKYVGSRIEYKYKLNHHHNILLDTFGNNQGMLDHLIKDIDINRYGIPILIKKYLSLGGKILGFNLDPDFNYAIDALVILDVETISEDILNLYSK
jgi:putative hemolysin